MTIEQTRDQIVDQFSTVLTEAESLLNKATHETGEKARDLRTQAEARLLSAKLKLQELQGQAVDRAKDAARQPTTTSMTTRGRRSASRPRSAWSPAC